MALKNSMGGMISQVSRMISPPGEQDLSEQVCCWASFAWMCFSCSQ